MQIVKEVDDMLAGENRERVVAKVNSCTFSVVLLTIVARDAQDPQTALSSIR
jgi:hypothetical protein